MVKKEEIEKMGQKIVREYKPEKIYLFGSFVWGKPNNDSDVDLFIVKETSKHRHKRQVEVRKIINGKLPVDVLVYTPQETEKRLRMRDLFIKDILEKGKLLYSAK